jgi:hypothetical protein
MKPTCLQFAEVIPNTATHAEVTACSIAGLNLSGSHALDTSPLVIGGKSFRNLTELCGMYGLLPAGSSDRVPNVFDFFLAGPYELAMIEIRLQTLAEVVDAFVPVESRMTFQGNRK